MFFIPENRVTKLTTIPPSIDGRFVLYWMTAYRRTRYNFALQQAIAWANELKKPLVVLEAIRLHYPWACDRFHRFMLDGMVDNYRSIEKSKAVYLPYVERKTGEANGLVDSLAEQACVVVSDDFPCFFLPKMYRLVSKRRSCAFEVVDSNGLLPMSVADRTFTVAHSYRRFMQKVIRDYLDEFPDSEPLCKLDVPPIESATDILSNRWSVAGIDELIDFPLRDLAIDHSVKPTSMRGGETAAGKALSRFVQSRLENYAEDRNEPSKHGSSNLSPFLHFGHIGAHEIFNEIMRREAWTPSKLGKPNGKMTGFWNVGSHAEAFLDQLVTWREIGFNLCRRESNYDRFESLPDWARRTLAEHASDRREHVYSLEQFEAAATHDDLWNAAQRQLVREGFIHNYLRMLWGKKILHWSQSPEEALRIMIHLNNKFALDGRDPNSYSGIFWVLGRYDRAWGPERPVFGKVRYMTSESTRSKYRVKDYLERYRQ